MLDKAIETPVDLVLNSERVFKGQIVITGNKRGFHLTGAAED
jgi:flagellar motor switch/type III secretory pathway protein FliN